jgi:hypothetical protein
MQREEIFLDLKRNYFENDKSYEYIIKNKVL